MHTGGEKKTLLKLSGGVREAHRRKTRKADSVNKGLTKR